MSDENAASPSVTCGPSTRSRKGEKCPTCGEFAVIHSAPYPCIPYEGVDCTPEEAVAAVKAVRRDRARAADNWMWRFWWATWLLGTVIALALRPDRNNFFGLGLVIGVGLRAALRHIDIALEKRRG